MKDRATVTQESNKAQRNKNKNGRRPNTGKFAWKDVPPKSNEKTTKEVNGKVYHWCKYHNQ